MLEGVRYVLETSGDLNDWNEAEVLPIRVPRGEKDLLRYQVSGSPLTVGEKFFRMKYLLD